MIFRCLSLCASLMVCTHGYAQEAEKKVATPDEQESAAVKSPAPNVVKLSETRYRAGKVEFDSKTREIRLPVRVNMNGADGNMPLEFLVVRPHGKVHESLFMTDATGLDINLAFTLLRYTPSPEFYALPNGKGGLSGQFPKVPKDVQDAARIRIEIEQITDGALQRIPVEHWLQHTTKLTAMPASPWTYGGSEFMNGQYVPETTGDLIAIYTSRASLVNYAGEEHENDNAWQAFPKRVPAIDAEVMLIISPFSPNLAVKP